MLTRSLILASLTLLMFAPFCSLSAGAEEGSASLDSMWIDQEAPTIDKQQPGATQAVAGSLPSIVAPMCSFSDFRTSGFVSKGSWPGLGPFKATLNDISEMTDDRENHLKVNVKSDQVTSALLGLGKLGSGNVKDFLDIQMASDFLLESLGAKPRKIVEFNRALEKSRSALKPGSSGVSLAAGRYQVTVDRSDSARPYSCLISVNSLDASRAVIAEHGAAGGEQTVEETKPESKLPIIAAITKKPKPTTAAINPTVDPKRDEFTAAIKSWQQVKKAALKKRDPAHLSDVLAGPALSKQMVAVKWLQSHGNYYDMEPRGCLIDKYTDLGGGRKFSVVAQVREFSKYIREADNAVLKEVDDKYMVDYTIEKINDKWMITDSSVINANQPAQQAQSARPRTH